MAAGPALLDVNTGQPTTTNSYRQPTSEIQTTQTGGREDVATTGGNTQSRGSQISSTSALNTTPQALDALHSLIASLTERPAISEDELNARVPLATPVYSPAGWQWNDPLTGRYINSQEANRLNALRKGEQKRIQQTAGTVSGTPTQSSGPVGTQEQQQQQNERRTEVGRVRGQQGIYGKDAALADAQHLVDKAIADALRAAEPGITLASEGAGTSKSTYRAGALQEAATRGGIEGAALGANLSVAYGQIFNQLEGILEQLTRIDPNGPTATLLQALQASKGMVQSSTTGTDTSGNQNTTGSTNTKVGPATATQTVQRGYENPALGPLPLAGANQPAAAAQPTNPVYGFAEGLAPPSPISITSNAPAQSEVGTFDANAAYQEVAMSDEEY